MALSQQVSRKAVHPCRPQSPHSLTKFGLVVWCGLLVCRALLPKGSVPNRSWGGARELRTVFQGYCSKNVLSACNIPSCLHMSFSMQSRRRVPQSLTVRCHLAALDLAHMNKWSCASDKFITRDHRRHDVEKRQLGKPDSSRLN